MAQPMVLRFKTDTEQARRGVETLARIVVTSMASVSAASVAAHQTGGSALAGYGEKALNSAKAIAALAAAHQVAIAAFSAYLAAVGAGAAELERFQKIAEKAAASNIGTTYFQAFTVGAERLGAKLKDAEGDLAALERSARTRFSSDSFTGRQNKAVDRFEQAFLDVPTSQASPALDMLRNAQSAEEQLRAITQGLADLEAQGRRLLAIDIARDLGMRELPELVERGKTSFVDFLWQVRELEATGIKDGSLISPELIKNASDLRDRFTAIATQVANNVRPVLDECARLALDIGNNAAWAAEQFNRVLGVVGNIVRFLREGVDLIGRLGKSDVGSRVMASERIDGLRGEIQETERQLAAIPQPRFGADIRAAERETLKARIVQMRGEIEALSQMAAEENRARALGNLPPPPSQPTTPAERSATKAPPPGANAGAATASAEETDKRTEAIEKFIRAQERGIELSRIELETIGKTAVERARLTEVAKAEARAREEGGTLTNTERERIAALAEAQQKLKNAVEDATAAQRAQAEAWQWVGDKMVDVALRGGKVSDVFKALSVEMARAALTGQGVFAKLLGLAPGAGSPTGSLGGLLGLLMGGGGGGGGGGFLSAFGLFHDGGVIGDGRVSGHAPAAMFAHAPRFHGGGRLRPDEVPIVGQIGEEVLTRNQRRAVAHSLAMGEAAMDAMSRGRGGVVVEGNTYNFQGVTAADRAWIMSEMDRRDAQAAERVVPLVQKADRTGVEVLPHARGR
ncbi:hypothetical protein [Phreatobacter oligotrophus]|uniref:hypothetical protein n=1 Tax=Phreatobacter oligotrophus TaxID=1122261 RepID=UPI002353FCFD|nr:hypothetical protein [Phreatobacter oligotrophus]MBX9990925.1 hypothetical protein [Phreatobacter oligotrophus]